MLVKMPVKTMPIKMMSRKITSTLLLASAGLLLPLTSAQAACTDDMAIMDSVLAGDLAPAKRQSLITAKTYAEAALKIGREGDCEAIIAAAMTAGGSGNAAKRAVNPPRTADTSPRAGYIGQLSDLRNMAEGVLLQVQSSNPSLAKLGGAQLQSSWEAVSLPLKEKNPESWTAIDQALHEALSELNTQPFSASASSSALTALITAIDQTK